MQFDLLFHIGDGLGQFACLLVVFLPPLGNLQAVVNGRGQVFERIQPVLHLRAGLAGAAASTAASAALAPTASSAAGGFLSGRFHVGVSEFQYGRTRIDSMPYGSVGHVAHARVAHTIVKSRAAADEPAVVGCDFKVVIGHGQIDRFDVEQTQSLKHLQRLLRQIAYIIQSVADRCEINVRRAYDVDKRGLLQCTQGFLAAVCRLADLVNVLRREVVAAHVADAAGEQVAQLVKDLSVIVRPFHHIVHGCHKALQVLRKRLGVGVGLRFPQGVHSVRRSGRALNVRIQFIRHFGVFLGQRGQFRLGQFIPLLDFPYRGIGLIVGRDVGQHRARQVLRAFDRKTVLFKEPAVLLILRRQQVNGRFPHGVHVAHVLHKLRIGFQQFGQIFGLDVGEAGFVQITRQGGNKIGQSRHLFHFRNGVRILFHASGLGLPGLGQVNPNPRAQILKELGQIRQFFFAAEDNGRNVIVQQLGDQVVRRIHVHPFKLFNQR